MPGIIIGGIFHERKFGFRVSTSRSQSYLINLWQGIKFEYGRKVHKIKEGLEQLRLLVYNHCFYFVLIFVSRSMVTLCNTPRDLQIVEKIDEIKELEAVDSSWPLKINAQFKRMMKSCDDEELRSDRFNLFTPIDELWIHRDHYEAYNEEMDNSPFHRPIGYNPKLGDKNMFLKDF